jgi:peptidyl-prolyl cis-trans isomerase C
MRPRHPHHAFVCAVFALLLPLRAQNAPPILATVNGRQVTAVQVREMAMKNNHPLATKEGFEAALKDAINFEVLAAEAAKQGYENDPEIRKLVKAMAVQRMLKEKVEAPAESARTQPRPSSASAQQELRPASAAIAVTDEELNALYEKSKAEFTQPTLVRGQVLFVLSRKGKESDYKKKLADVKAAIAAKTGFGDLVANFSDNPAAQTNGGMTNWLVAGQEDKQFPKEVTSALFAAKDANVIAGPIAAGQGSYWVKLAERREGKTMTFDEVRRVLHERVYRRKASAAYDEFVAGLAKDVKIERNAEGIAAMQKALADEAGGPPAGPVTIRPAEPPPAENPKPPPSPKKK